jgi:hypothetical protein
LNNGLTSSVKADTMLNDWVSWLLRKMTHIHNWTGHFSFWIKSYNQKYLFWYKIIWQNDRLIEVELMNDGISRNPVPNGTDRYQNAHRVSLCSRTQSQHFGISNSQTTELPWAHLPFFVGVVSLICEIKYDEFDYNWPINILFNITMTRRDLDGPNRVSWDFISGHWMRLHMIVRSDLKSTSIIIIEI